MALPKQVVEGKKKAEDFVKDQEGEKITSENIPDEGNPEGNPDVTPVVDKDWKSEYEKSEHKYNVLQGKYSAEVPRSSAKVKELTKKDEEAQTLITSQREEIDGLKSQSIDDEEQILETDYPGITEYINKRVDEKAKNLSRSDNPDVTQKVERLENRVNKTAEDDFFGKLAKDVPNWEKIVKDENFALFLQEIEPYSGKSKYDLLEEAQNSLNANRVAQFYLDYQPAETPKGKKVEDFVSPGSGVTPAPADNTQPAKSFTEEKIQSFYSDLARGKFKGVEGKKRADAIKAQINAYLTSKRE